MGIRHLSRQRALQLLYAMEFNPSEEFTEVEHRFLNLHPSYRRGWGPFARALSQAAWEHRTELDEAIAPLLRGWSLDRLPRIDLLCLRMALAELRYFADIPLRVTLNEYIDLVRMFSQNESSPYVNAVLDRLSREFPQKDFRSSDAPAPEPESEPSSGSSEAPKPAAPKRIRPSFRPGDTKS